MACYLPECTLFYTEEQCYMTALPLILGSQSQGRQSVLKNEGYTFTTMSANIDEVAALEDCENSTDPWSVVMHLAHKKKQALMPRITTPSLLITSDQVVVCGYKILGKPKDANEMRRFLNLYKVHPTKTVGSILVTYAGDQAGRSVYFGAVVVATVYLAELHDATIEQLIKEGKGFSAAGGFRVEDPLLLPYIKKIDGTVNQITGICEDMTKNLISRVTRYIKNQWNIL